MKNACIVFAIWKVAVAQIKPVIWTKAHCHAAIINLKKLTGRIVVPLMEIGRNVQPTKVALKNASKLTWTNMPLNATPIRIAKSTLVSTIVVLMVAWTSAPIGTGIISKLATPNKYE